MSISAKRNKRKGYKDDIIRVPIVSYIKHVWHPYYIGGIPLSIYISNQFLTIVFPWGVNTLSGWNWMP